MKSKFIIAFLILFIFLFSACQKEPIPKPLPEPGYPTTYKPLSSAEWEARNTEFQKINIHEGMSLNEYGFVEGEIQLDENNSLNKESIILNLEIILEKFGNYMGIVNYETINLKNDLRIHIPGNIGGYSTTIDNYFKAIEEFEKNNSWPIDKKYFRVLGFYLSQTTIENNLFYGPNLYFSFDEDNFIININGKWFPTLFIPEADIYTEGDAISIAYRRMLKETGIDYWESKQNFKYSKLYFWNVQNGVSEIRHCWRIDIPEHEGMNYFLIDTQTGEIIHWCVECYYM